jgi:transposase
MSNQKKVVHSQGREIIYNVYKFMKNEKDCGEVSIPLNRLQKRVAEATGVGICTLRRIIQEAENKPVGSKFTSPRKKINQPKPKQSVDQYEEEIIRNIIYTYADIHKRRPTMKAVYEAVKDEGGVNFTGKIRSFRRLVHKIGFRWKKTQDNRKTLVEKFDIKAKRVEYLRRITRYREEGWNIIYCDETYLHSSHTSPLAWDDGSNRCLKVPVGKGSRLIILHAGGATGFVPNALTIFKSGTKSGDYHHEMNSENFMKWLTEKFVKNVSAKSVLVVDNASYHNVPVQASPTSAWKKADMQKWLMERGIFFEQKCTKAELYGIIKVHKPVHKIYKIDQILAESNIPVLRLPPYHPELNPIEKIWALMKNHVAAYNTTFKLDDVRKLAEAKFEAVTVQQWQNICSHVEKIEVEYMKREYIVDEVEDLIISINGEESDESDFFLSSDEEQVDEKEVQGRSSSSNLADLGCELLT